MPFYIDGKQVFRCPLTFITELSWGYIEAYRFFEKNITPNNLGYINESYKYCQAIGIVSSEFIRWQNKKAEKNGRDRPKYNSKANR